MEDLKSFKSGFQGATPDLSISDEVFSLFADLIYKTSGIKLNITKKGLLTSRLLKRLKRHEIKGFHDYYQKVEDDNEELVEMLNCISTNTTKFFRENYHFEYLKSKIIPELIKNKFTDKIIRIWSAGCSTGEEPYSIAIAVNEALSKVSTKQYAVSREQKRAGSDKGAYCVVPTAYCSDWDIKILATDISTKVLETAQAGIYEYEQLPDDMPPDMVGRYFLRGVKENEGKIRVKNFIGDMIRFRRLNLKDGVYPFQRRFDVIFCRNVMIYFDEGMKQHVFSKFHYHLCDNGYLFLGHSETLLGNGKFKPIYITVYRKK